MVVYKVDRLTRSLADFAKLVELFDQHGVSFVSITQSFNTTSSMGRLTLNVLLSFAQFEREVIGERVRDKIAASKRKGIWVGGPVPLGYRCIDKKLVIAPEEAETVTSDLQALSRIRLDGRPRRGTRSQRHSDQGQRSRRWTRQGRHPLRRGTARPSAQEPVLHRRSRLSRRGASWGAEPILARDLFEAVQTRLAANAVARQVRLKGSAAILTGRIFDDRGNRMSPTHSNKHGVRYRYYVSHALLQKRNAAVGSVGRVPAPEIEALVLDGVRQHLASDGADPAMTDRDLIERHVERVTIKSQAVEVRFVSPSDVVQTEANGPARRLRNSRGRSRCHGRLQASRP